MESSGLQNRLIQIFGIKSAENLLEVDYTNELISLTGFISKPSFTKKSKQDQMLFLNKRYVVSKSLSYAVHHAYEDLVDKGDFPSFFLFLNLNPEHYDVNVHPSKLEVKFDDERALFSFIRRGVLSTLEKNDLVFNVKTDSTPMVNVPVPNILSSDSFTKKETAFSFKKHQDITAPVKKNNIHEIFDAFKPEDSGTSDENEQNVSINEPSEQAGEAEFLINRSELWQFQKKYIMYQLESTLMIIDQHAAHERILYEQAIDRLNSNANLSQQLLFPISAEFSIVDFEIIKSLEKELGALGFDITLTSKNKVKISGIPSDVRIGDEGKIPAEFFPHTQS